MIKHALPDYLNFIKKKSFKVKKILKKTARKRNFLRCQEKM